VDTGPLPVIAPGMDNVEANGVVRLHNELHSIYTEYNHVDAALKHKIISQYDGMYLAALEEYMVGFANVSVLDLLPYLGAAYGQTNPTGLASNYNLMTTPYGMQ
jgi:hypothetical protein